MGYQFLKTSNFCRRISTGPPIHHSDPSSLPQNVSHSSFGLLFTFWIKPHHLEAKIHQAGRLHFKYILNIYVRQQSTSDNFIIHLWKWPDSGSRQQGASAGAGAGDRAEDADVLSSSFINQTVYCSKQEFIFDFTKYILRQFVLYINGIVSNNWLTSFSAPLHNNYQQLYIVLDRLPSLVLGRQDSLLAAPHGPGGQLQPLPLTLACNVCNLGSNKQRR